MGRPKGIPRLKQDTDKHSDVVMVPAEGSALAKDYIHTTKKIAGERLKRLRHQNAKLSLEVRKIKGHVGDLDSFKREVLAANATVKQQLLAIPYRLSEPLSSVTEPREVARLLHQAIVEALNDLAYERGTDGQ